MLAGNHAEADKKQPSEYPAPATQFAANHFSRGLRRASANEPTTMHWTTLAPIIISVIAAPKLNGFSNYQAQTYRQSRT